MKPNRLIVESKNDKAFIEALIKDINLTNTQVDDSPICSIDDYECLDGLSAKKLTEKLRDITNDISIGGIKKIGIIIDADMVGIEGRIELINKCLKSVFGDLTPLTQHSQTTDATVKNTPLTISCFIMNLDGFGELETVLKTIKTQNSPYADCLDNWRECLRRHGEQVDTEKFQKEFNKFWVNNYIRFDTCNKNDMTQAERKCSVKNIDYVMENKPSIFDLQSEKLKDLRDYLQSFE